MRHLTVEQIRELDRKAQELYSIPSIILMENAGHSVASETMKLLNRRLKPRTTISQFHISVICGSGNNGGDGVVAARYLYNENSNIFVFLLKKLNEYKDDTLTNLIIAKKIGIKLETIKDLKTINSQISKSHVIIDAIFGTGLKREITGIYKDIIELINNSNRPVVSVDIPSGLDGNTGKSLGVCVRAHTTVTMGYLKKGFLNPESKKFVGKLVVSDIGYPKVLCRRGGNNRW